MWRGSEVYAGLFWRRAVSEGERVFVSWRVSRIMSSVISGGRGDSMVLAPLLVRECRGARLSSVSGSLVRASINICVFAASTWWRCSSYI